MNQPTKYGKGQETEALKEAIREVAEAKKVNQNNAISEKLGKIAQLLSVVQV